ncbi:hypothetical protein SAMN04487988_10373 [Algoriphagus hitonicola]|uniref:Uncharacterized protein n=1 Tax=Algoriphagus hitonicola TaxID=435880 RepID=A0A1I2R509_9BACT|nr:hypothetical protein SAMN04487988_10373 [Algoriphagus hitonicola]
MANTKRIVTDKKIDNPLLCIGGGSRSLEKHNDRIFQTQSKGNRMF